MEYTNEKLGCSFGVPDRPTVRQQLAYWSNIRAFEEDAPTIIRLWLGVAGIVQDWACEALPDPKTSLDDIDNPTQTLVVQWAALQVFSHFNKLADLPKA